MSAALQLMRLRGVEGAERERGIIERQVAQLVSLVDEPLSELNKLRGMTPEAVREEYVDGFGLSEAEFGIVRSLGAQGGRRFLVKQGHSSAICELDLAGLEDFITVLSATTDNVALLDAVRGDLHRSRAADADRPRPAFRSRPRRSGGAGDGRRQPAGCARVP
mgnify:CR=1 FL=1